MLIVGLGHRARQGKNTAALAMLEACPLETQVRMYAYADALRQEVRSACAKMGGQFDLIAGYKEAGLMPEWVRFEEPKPRSLLQWWGTDYRRAADPDYWVKRLEKTLTDQQPDIALITDVRFPNEADAIHAMNGYLVKCVRTGTPDIEVHEHPSEAALDAYRDWDFYITADSVDECKRQARETLAEIVRIKSCSCSPILRPTRN